MRNIMVILDGIQDKVYAELGGNTPLDAGKREAIGLIQGASVTGFLRATPPEWEADTQTCVLTLLGVEPADIPPGRSYIEALALGLEVGDEDIIMRCNFVQVDEEGHLAVPCCSAPEPLATTLRADVAAQPGHHVTPVGSYKSLQRIENGKRYLDTLRTSTPHQHAGEVFEELLPHGNELGDALAEFSRKKLEEHRPYTVLNWGAAVKADLPSFASLHGGISGAMVSATDAPIGIAAAMGLECPRIAGTTGDTDTDLAAKCAATLELSQRNEFVMLHVGGPDEATHRQNPVEKAEFIAKLDRELIQPLLDGLESGDRLMLTCDHVALCETAGHTDEPVEFWLWEKNGALSGDIGVQEGTDAVEILLGKKL